MFYSGCFSIKKLSACIRFHGHKYIFLNNALLFLIEELKNVNVLMMLRTTVKEKINQVSKYIEEIYTHHGRRNHQKSGKEPIKNESIFI